MKFLSENNNTCDTCDIVRYTFCASMRQSRNNPTTARSINKTLYCPEAESNAERCSKTIGLALKVRHEENDRGFRLSPKFFYVLWCLTCYADHRLQKEDGRSVIGKEISTIGGDRGVECGNIVRLLLKSGYCSLVRQSFKCSNGCYQSFQIQVPCPNISTIIIIIVTKMRLTLSGHRAHPSDTR